MALRLTSVSDAFSALAKDVITLASGASTPEVVQSRCRARSLLRFLRKCGEHLGADIFGDPALVMLLDLFVAESELKLTSVSSLCAVSGAPATTALRYLDALEEQGLVSRRPHPSDRRSTLIELTERARTTLSELLEAMG